MDLATLVCLLWLNWHTEAAIDLARLAGLRPVGSDEFLHVIMPMHLGN